MYESHFGLKSRPFTSKAEGTAVFVGPGQAQAINGMHKGLLAQDAVVTVTGPVGCGKTTIVNRALQTISPGRVAASVGRMNISSDEVLELLLAGFGFARKTNSTLQRFAAFRRFMNERAVSGLPVAIIVEDARKLGVTALAEIEALTASDTADGGGANIVLMGDEAFNDLFADPELARLRQRIRRRIRLAPLNEAEVGGYLRHAIREAGGRYDTLFEDGVVGLVYACSAGTPRVINTLCESALAAAAEDGDPLVTLARMHAVAADVYGYEGPAPAAAADDEKSEVTAKESLVGIPPISIPGIDDGDIPESAHNLVVESGRYPLEQDSDEKYIDGLQDTANTIAEPEAQSVPVAESEPVAEPEWTADRRSQTEAPASTSSATPGLQEPVACDIVDDEPTLTDIVDDEPTLTDIVDDEPTLTDIVCDEPTMADTPDLINDTEPQLEALSDAIDKLLATNGPDQSHVNQPAQANDKADDDESFDLDAALSPEVEATNMMPGVTADLDDIAAADAVSHDTPHAATLADLPTLSDSMRVYAKKAVRRPADEIGDPVTPSATVPAPDAEPTADTTADSVPVAACDDDHDLNFEADSIVARESAATRDDSSGAESAENAADDTSGPDLEPEPTLEFDPDFLLESIPTDGSESMLAAAVETDAADGVEDESAAMPVDTDEVPVMSEPTDQEPELASDFHAPEPAPAVTAETTLDRALEELQVQGRKLADMSSSIADVNSLEDIDDMMSETMFGEEFTEIADSAVVDDQLVDPNAGDAAEADTAITDVATAGACDDDAPGTAQATGATAATAHDSTGEAELRQSVATHIDAINDMKAKVANQRTEVVELGEEPARRTHHGPQPEPIERQINTSLTQTLEALKISHSADAEAVPEADSKKNTGGLFARFRRTP